MRWLLIFVALVRIEASDLSFNVSDPQVAFNMVLVLQLGHRGDDGPKNNDSTVDSKTTPPTTTPTIATTTPTTTPTPTPTPTPTTTTTTTQIKLGF